MSDSVQTLKPGQVIRPNLTSDGAVILATDLYGLRVNKIKELNSYDDKNFLVIPDVATNNNKFIKQIDPNGYVLKVLNAMDTQKKHVDAEHEAAAVLHQHGVHCPLPVLTVNGDDKSIVQLPTIGTTTSNNNQPDSQPFHMVRLLTFVPGIIFGSIPYTPDMLYKAGNYVARLQQALKGFTHPALVGHSTIWDLRSVPKLKDFVFAVTDENNKQLVNSVIEAFTTQVEPLYPQFSKGIIHGDFNEQNILVQPIGGSEPPTYEIAGIIDFGDMSENYYVLELAMTIMYMTIESKVIDPMLAGGHVLAGYTAVKPITDVEFDALKTCVAGRFIQSLVMGAYTYLMDPGNDYVLTTAARGWFILHQLWEIPSEQLYANWRQVIQSYT